MLLYLEIFENAYTYVPIEIPAIDKIVGWKFKSHIIYNTFLATKHVMYIDRLQSEFFAKVLKSSTF